MTTALSPGVFLLYNDLVTPVKKFLHEDYLGMGNWAEHVVIRCDDTPWDLFYGRYGSYERSEEEPVEAFAARNHEGRWQIRLRPKCWVIV